jgi:hypothetical protein
MPEGFGWLLLLMLIGGTLYWAAIWYWLPAFFERRERERSQARPKVDDADASPKARGPKAS